MNKKEKGFTLIELLVVIAIMGILASIIFLAINPKEQSDKAKIATVKFAIDSMRVPITDYFSKNDFSYENVGSDLKIAHIISSTPGMSLESNKNLWAVKALLLNGKYFCRDSRGYVSEKLIQDITDFMCD